MTVGAVVDRDLCIGAGNCIRLARGYFELDDEDIAVVVNGAGASREDLEAAERACPASAIVVEEGAEDGS